MSLSACVGFGSAKQFEILLTLNKCKCDTNWYYLAGQIPPRVVAPNEEEEKEEELILFWTYTEICNICGVYKHT